MRGEDLRRIIKKFDKSELIMVTLYQEKDRKTTIKTIREMTEALYYDEYELKNLSEDVIMKLERITDEEFTFLMDEVLPYV